jgi:hypothetical protein
MRRGGAWLRALPLDSSHQRNSAYESNCPTRGTPNRDPCASAKESSSSASWSKRKTKVQNKWVGLGVHIDGIPQDDAAHALGQDPENAVAVGIC